MSHDNHLELQEQLLHRLSFGRSDLLVQFSPTTNLVSHIGSIVRHVPSPGMPPPQFVIQALRIAFQVLRQLIHCTDLILVF